MMMMIAEWGLWKHPYSTSKYFAFMLYAFLLLLLLFILSPLEASEFSILLSTGGEPCEISFIIKMKKKFPPKNVIQQVSFFQPHRTADNVGGGIYRG